MKQRLTRIARMALVACTWQCMVVWTEILGQEWEAYNKLLDSIQ